MPSQPSEAPMAPYCLREDNPGKKVGHQPSWAADRHRSFWFSPPSRTWLRVLLFPIWAPVWLYRRVIYDGRPDVVAGKTRPQEWRALQSEMRYLQAVFFYVGPPSHVLWHIKYPLLLDMAIAVLITVNQSFEYYRLLPFLPDLDTLVSNSFRLITFVLALLLTFRINRTYDRWWQARQGFAGVGSAALAMSQQAMQWVKDPAIRAEIFRWCKIWHYSILQVCKGGKLIDPKAAVLMADGEREAYHSSRKGRQLMILQLRRLITMADLSREEFLTMEGSLQAGLSAAGVCTRLKFQAMPYSVTLMSTGFLQIWLMFLPCAIITVLSPAPSGDNPAFGLVIYFFTAVLMLGVDEVANQLEQPFPHLPLEEIAETTIRDIDRVPEEYAVWEKLQDEALARQHTRISRRQQNVKDPSTAAAAPPYDDQSEQQQQQGDTVISVVT